MKQILSDCSASISELKRNPTAILKEARGASVTRGAILNHKVPAAYRVPAETYEWLLDRVEDAELAEIVAQRTDEMDQAVTIDLDTLID